MANTPKFMVSYLKSMYGAAAAAANDFGYDWHPKIIGITRTWRCSWR